jgi:predicted dehydrogenase
MVDHDSPLRVGIVGLGFGAAVHAPGLLGFTDVEVVGIAGRSAEKAAAIAKNLGIPNGFGSIADLLELGLDAITIALPPDQVEAAVEQALANQVPVLCEKPLGGDHKTALSLVHRANTVTCCINFTFAELEVFIRLKQLIDSGSLGKVRHANVLWLTESWAHQNQKWSWKTDITQSGGVLTLFGSHLFYLVEWLFGPTKSVFCHMSPPTSATFAPPNFQAAEDLADCCFEHTSGVSVSCTFGNANPGITVHRWTVIFDYGTVIVENSSADYTAFSMSIQKPNTAVDRFFEPNDLYRDGRLQPFRRLARRFIDGVRCGIDVRPNFVDGTRVQFLDASVRASAMEKNIIILNDYHV